MPNHSDIRFTYIGGPALLIEVDGLELLTDRTFDPPQEFQAGAFVHSKIAVPALEASQIGEIDVVLLTHDHHFDNLDHSGRDFLGKAKRVLTTAAAADRLQGNTVGLEAWQSIVLTTASNKTLSVTATPARHGPEGMTVVPLSAFC
jgi:L-ascorbate metabolism protein UlaG (beta-lactamase superfamily)